MYTTTIPVLLAALIWMMIPMEWVDGIGRSSNHSFNLFECITFLWSPRHYIVLLMVHSWFKQACTEMVMPMSYSENRSMYPPYKFDYASYADSCIKSYGVRPRPRWITTEFGGHVSFFLCSIITILSYDKRVLLFTFPASLFNNRSPMKQTWTLFRWKYFWLCLPN